MRQRNIKNLDERIEANANYLIEDPRACRGHWREIFGNENPIYLEIGCGKGQFIMKACLKKRGIAILLETVHTNSCIIHRGLLETKAVLFIR